MCVLDPTTKIVLVSGWNSETESEKFGCSWEEGDLGEGADGAHF